MGKDPAWFILAWMILVAVAIVFGPSQLDSGYQALTNLGFFNRLTKWTLPALAAPVLLFVLKGKIPLFYGFIEIAGGSLAIIYAMPGLADDTIPALLAFLTGIYFMIRGLDNFSKGLKKGQLMYWIFTKILRVELDKAK